MEKKTLDVQVSQIYEKYQLIRPHLNERNRRLWAATESAAIGHGGMTVVHHATGMSFTTIKNGIMNLNENVVINGVRKKGGGRKKKIVTDPLLFMTLLKLSNLLLGAIQSLRYYGVQKALAI